MYVGLIFCFLTQIRFSSSQIFSNKYEESQITVQAQRKWIDSVLDGMGVLRASKHLHGISEQSIKSNSALVRILVKIFANIRAGLELARVLRVPVSEHHLWYRRILRFLILTDTRRAHSIQQVAPSVSSF